MQSGDFLAAPRRFETYWTLRSHAWRRHPRVADVRVRGSILAVELRDAGGYLAPSASAIRRKCLQMGVLLRPLGNVLYAMPPYCCSQASLDRIAAAIEAVLAEPLERV